MKLDRPLRTDKIADMFLLRYESFPNHGEPYIEKILATVIELNWVSKTETLVLKVPRKVDKLASIVSLEQEYFSEDEFAKKWENDVSV